MPVETQKQSAIIEELTLRPTDVSTIRLGISFAFTPGQSIAVTFPGDPKKRFYSISSSPTEGKFVEITLKAETGSAFVKTINSLKKGDTLEVEGPFASSLALPDPLTQTVAFIAAGTGVTPFRSMIKNLIDHKASTEFYLLHSVSKQYDLLFEGDFRDWAGQNPHFHYIPTITRDFDNNWKHETGRIGEALIRKHVPEHPCTYLLCGPNHFVNDMEKLLKDNLKIASDRIRREKW